MRYEKYKRTSSRRFSEIPACWDARKIKYFSTISNGSDPKTEGDVPVYGSGEGSFKTCGEFKEGPVVLLGRKGATLHIPHYITGKYWNVDTAFGIEPNEEFIIVDYLYMFCVFFNFEKLNKAVTIPSLTKVDLLKIEMPFDFYH